MRHSQRSIRTFVKTSLPLRFTDEGSRPSLVLLLYHDDPEREIAYTDGAVDVQRMAEGRGWQAVSMRRDFKKVFIESPAP